MQIDYLPDDLGDGIWSMRLDVLPDNLDDEARPSTGWEGLKAGDIGLDAEGLRLAVALGDKMDAAVGPIRLRPETRRDPDGTVVQDLGRMGISAAALRHADTAPGGVRQL